MSKHWNPPRQTAKPRPSRIRRDPLLVPALPAAEKKRDWKSTEWERNFAIAGIVLFAFVIVASTLAVSAFTAGFGVGPAPQAERFGSCRNEGGPDCVLDAGTIRVDGVQITIAGMQVPKVEAAHCAAEQDRGAKAVEKLLQLLNSGKVTEGAAVRGADGVWRRPVQVDGRDVAGAMIAANLARDEDASSNWC